MLLAPGEQKVITVLENYIFWSLFEKVLPARLYLNITVTTPTGAWSDSVHFADVVVP